jgi:DNA polymerase I
MARYERVSQQPHPGSIPVTGSLCQIDIAVVAGLAGDEALIDAYNSGDVYATTAKTIFKTDLPKSAQKLSSHKFKTKYPEFRKMAKETLLRIMYGSTAKTVARNLGISSIEAQVIITSLSKANPVTFKFLKENLEHSLRRGYAKSLLGFRRYTNHLFGDQENRKKLSNAITNHPIQATSSEVFKAADIKLSRLLKKYDAFILVSLHDSYLIEAPYEHFEKVVRLTKKVMTETLTEFSPKSKAR